MKIFFKFAFRLHVSSVYGHAVKPFETATIFRLVNIEFNKLIMKLFNRIIIFFEALCALGILWCMISIATPTTRPEDILSAVDLELSDYDILNKSDNLDRGASRFDNFIYDVTFPQEDMAALIKQMQDGDWQKENDIYVKTVVVDEALTYSAFINPQLRTATLDVLIDEDYSLIYYVYAILFILASTFFAVIWGLVKVFSKVISKIKNRNQQTQKNI